MLSQTNHAQAPPSDSLDALVTVLADALRALGTDGRPDDASRLAGRAYAALRRGHPAQAQRINALMHGLARMPATRQEQNMTITDRQLDVRSEPPARRHELIFDSYENLAAGKAFVLVNDHDPKPLRYQFEAEHAGLFTWEYLEEGPE